MGNNKPYVRITLKEIYNKLEEIHTDVTVLKTENKTNRKWLYGLTSTIIVICGWLVKSII